MKKNILVSILIPTYNREKYLPQCIDSIVTQYWFNDLDIEIIISDNASTDSTQNIVKEYQKKYSNIRYFRNEENLGMVKNVTKIVEYATWKYSWIISDDDCLIENSLEKALKLISNDSINIYVLNYSNYNNKLNNIILENVMQINSDISLLDSNKFVNYIILNWDKIIWWLFFYVSNKIFKTELFNSQEIKKIILESDIKNEHKYAFPFSMILLKELINNGCYIISERYIKLRTENLCWNYNDLVIYQYYFYKYFIKNTNNKLLKNHLKKSILKIMFWYYLELITKKIWIYNLLSKIWIKYFLKR